MASVEGAVMERLLRAHRAALEAVDPGLLVSREPLERAPPWLLALGKAAWPMAEAALEQRSFQGALVVCPPRAGSQVGARVLHGSHPVPDQSSLAAGEAILEFGRQARGGLLVLLSGGGSALAEALVEGLTLDDLQATTRALLAGGAPVQAINAVRRHLSRLKGGRLAELVPGPVHTLALSDVLGSPPEAIASGPTAPDPSTCQEALEACRGLNVPERVLKVLASHETPKQLRETSYRVLADNRVMAEAACRELGPEARLLTCWLEGEARELGRFLACLAREGGKHTFVLSGEPTVTVRGPGRGGRCQELALSFALAAEGVNATLLAASSDGIDGPTDAAGAVVDGTTAGRARTLGLDPRASLEANDAYPLLQATSSLLVTGPSGTNTNDLFLLQVE
ncbi:MAG: hydroxypyruvate reductase [Candidatus Xenobia bacterium]